MYELDGIKGTNGNLYGEDVIFGKSVIVLSGIGNYKYFEYMVKKMAPKRIKNLNFPDHHFYIQKDIDTIIRCFNAGK